MKEQTKFALRLPTSLYETIRKEADKSGMSINEYMVHVMEQYHKLDVMGRLASLEMTVAKLAGFPEE